MVGIGNIFGMGLGATQVISGIGTMRSAGKVASEQRKIADLQYGYNKKEVERAFETNLEGLAQSYTKEMSSLFSNAEKTISQVNIGLGKKNVESESIENDINNELESDIQEAVLALVDSKKFAFDELANQKSAQLYQIGSDYAMAIGKINSDYINARSQAFGQIIGGALNIGKNGFDFYDKNYGGI